MIDNSRTKCLVYFIIAFLLVSEQIWVPYFSNYYVCMCKIYLSFDINNFLSDIVITFQVGYRGRVRRMLWEILTPAVLPP